MWWRIWTESQCYQIVSQGHEWDLIRSSEICVGVFVCLCAPCQAEALNIPSSGLVNEVYLKGDRQSRRESVCLTDAGLKMQHIYMQSNEHFEVFTTVFSPQG